MLYVLGTIVTLMQVPRATANFERFPWAALIVVVNLLAMANIPRAIYRECPFQAFLSSVVTIVALVSLLGLALWPNLATASNDRANSLTIYRAASSAKTLGTMLIIAVIGMPFVIGYTAAVYWTFRGEVKVDGF